MGLISSIGGISRSSCGCIVVGVLGKGWMCFLRSPDVAGGSAVVGMVVEHGDFSCFYSVGSSSTFDTQRRKHSWKLHSIMRDSPSNSVGRSAVGGGAGAGAGAVVTVISCSG